MDAHYGSEQKQQLGALFVDILQNLVTLQKLIFERLVLEDLVLGDGQEGSILSGGHFNVANPNKLKSLSLGVIIRHLTTT